jgi:F-box protein 21
MIFDGEDPGAYDRRRSHLQYLVPRLETTFMGDWYLFQDVIMPMFRQRAEEGLLDEASSGIRERDMVAPTPKYRTKEIRERIHFKVGTCFKHRKYSYVGMIVGWDGECMAPSTWQANHRVDNLTEGANQCFYNVV